MKIHEKLMKSPDYFFRFLFSALCQRRERRLNEVLNAVGARRLWFKGQRSQRNRSLCFLPYFQSKTQELFRLAVVYFGFDKENSDMFESWLLMQLQKTEQM